MSISDNAPIRRLGRWLRASSLGELLVLLLAPVAGILIVVLVGGGSSETARYPGRVLQNSLENMNPALVIPLFVLLGGVICLFGKRFGPWVATLSAGGLIIWATGATLADQPGHKLLPVELFVYALLGVCAAGGGYLGQRLRERQSTA
jgi:hypothetical protein